VPKKIFLFKLLLLCFLFLGALPAQARLVVVDPGHGGGDAGAVGPTGYQEKTANLDISLRLKQLLLNGGYQVVLTRETDISPNNPPKDLNNDGVISVTDDLEARVRIANKVNANVFVAVHNNAAPSAAEGAETYYWADNGQGYNPESKRLATLIQQEMVKQTGLYDRGVKYARFYVISPNRLKMPGALVEGAFITNPLEEALLKTASFRQKVAQGIYNGIRRFQPPNNIDSFTIKLPPKTRRSVYLNDYLTNVAYGLKLTATDGFVAERAMYYSLGDLSDVSNSLSVPSARKFWYFAEGFTAAGFDTFFTLANPTAYKATVTLTFLLDNGTSKSQTVTVNPFGRQTVLADQPLPNASFGTKIVSNYPIVAERAMYFTIGSINGASTTVGSQKPRYRWYFANGKASNEFDTWLLVLNPQEQAATATVTFFPENGSSYAVALNLPAKRRSSILLDNYASSNFGFKLESSLPVVAERSVYFNTTTANGGFTVLGRQKPKRFWYFAEGFTGGNFNTEYNLLNPSLLPAQVSITYFTPSGKALTTTQTVLPQSLATVSARTPGQIGPDKEFAAVVNSNQPILAERSVYYSLGGKNGAAAEFGAYGLAKTRFLAEGFTGSGFDNWLLLFNPQDAPIQVTVKFLK
jgi:N-acetylmuramoyl-L-alanine amidase